MNNRSPFQSPDVESVFATYSEELRAPLIQLRQLIFDTASELEGVGPLEETLKWGQPSYLTTQSGTGTTIRIDRIKSKPGRYAMYVHCQTSLLPTYRELYPEELRFDGNRCIEFNLCEEPPTGPLRHCIGLALTYHRSKKKAI